MDLRTLDDFKRCKVHVLKNFLRDRGLKVTGTKEELAALAYGASEMNVQVKQTKQEKLHDKVCSYSSLLTIDGTKLPDPFTELLNDWVTEADGVTQWPPTMHHEIAVYLLQSDDQDGQLSRRLLGDYKEGKAYSYFASGFLGEVHYNAISDKSPICFLRAQSQQSQHANRPHHNIWIAADKKSGDIKSAYCTCFAG